MKKIFAIAVIAVCAIGCGESPTEPSAGSSVAGSWVGSVSSQVAGAGSARVTFAQDGKNVSGTWAATFPNPSNNDAGTLSGRVEGASLQVVLNPGNPATCGYAVTASITGSLLAGTYTTVSCSLAIGGSINLTKQ